MSLQIPQFVLFDLDGTLVDSLPGIAYSVNQACRAVGIAPPGADLRSLLGPPIRVILSRLLATDDASLLDKLEAAFRATYDSEGWRKSSCFENVPEALEALKAGGHRLFVVSNKPFHIATRVLQSEGILPQFEKIYTRDSRQPHYVSKTEMIEGFLTDYAVFPSQCLMVGDTIDDITAAAETQVAAAFMQHGYGEVPSDFPVTFRLRSFSDFLVWLVVEDAR